MTPEGTALTCSDLGATHLEVSLFHLEEDVLPYHRQALPCQVSAEGSGSIILAVDVHRYARVVLRLVSAAGATVRLCVDGSTEEARLVTDACVVTKDTPGRVDWTSEALPGSCPAVPQGPPTLP